MDIAALLDFNATATHGGFGAASRATGTPKATLSRRVRALEAELGIRLFERGTRSLRLTEDGRALQERTSRLLDDLAEAGEEIAGRAGRPRGRLRVSVPVLFAQRSLGRFAACFVAAYPEVLLEIVVDDRYVDLVSDGFDIVVRANPRSDSLLVGQRLSSDVLAVVASPEIAFPSAPSESVPVVVLTAGADEPIWRFDGEHGPMELIPRTVLRFSSLMLVHDAVLAGAGVGIMPQALVAREIASGVLVHWGTISDRRIEAWALYPSRRLQSAKVTAFVSMLVSEGIIEGGI